MERRCDQIFAEGRYAAFTRRIGAQIGDAEWPCPPRPGVSAIGGVSMGRHVRVLSLRNVRRSRPPHRTSGASKRVSPCATEQEATVCHTPLRGPVKTTICSSPLGAACFRPSGGEDGRPACILSYSLLCGVCGRVAAGRGGKLMREELQCKLKGYYSRSQALCLSRKRTFGFNRGNTRYADMTLRERWADAGAHGQLWSFVETSNSAMLSERTRRWLLGFAHHFNVRTPMIPCDTRDDI